MSARILSLPCTVAGRRLLRDSVVERRGCWDFPDGSTAEGTDWDDLAISIAEMLRELDQLDRQADAYFASRSPR
jgi:hypothetical protein